MTKQEVRKLLAVITMTYQNFKLDDIDGTVDAWHFALEDFDYQPIALALKNYIQSDTKGFPPVVGQLISATQVPTDYGLLTEQEASTLVLKALRNSTYNSVAEFEKLPPLVQRAVGSASQLKIWASDENFNLQVVQSNIQRVYREVKAKDENYRRMTKEMQFLVGQQVESKPLIDAPKDTTTVPALPNYESEVMTEETTSKYVEQLREMLG